MEKFAGGLYTTTVEAFIPGTGRGIQGATSHCLGQNFAKMNNITFEAEQGKRKDNFVWQNSWGLTTRTIGVMVMVHSDDKGLVLPPRVAPVQVVIIPIYKKDNKTQVLEQCQRIFKLLTDANVRTEVDDRDHYNPGWKFNHWDLRGVTLRLEMGAQELAKECVIAHRRDLDDKTKDLTIAFADIVSTIPKLLNTVHDEMLSKARAEMLQRRKQVTEWKDFTRALDSGCTALAPHCEDRVCEASIKKRTGEVAVVDAQEEATDHEETGVEKLTGAAKTLCIPLEQPELKAEHICVGCGAKAKNWTLFGRSY